MEKRKIRTATKELSLEYAKTVAEKHFDCKVTQAEYIGGGSYGFVYRVQIEKEPYTLVAKVFRTEAMHISEAESIKLLSANNLVKMPEIYGVFSATQEIPVDIVLMEFMSGTDCFTDFKKFLKSRRKKDKFADSISEILNVWHNTTNDKFGLVTNAVFNDWNDYYYPFAKDVLLSARKLNKEKKLANSTLGVMEKAFAQYEFIFSEPVKEASLVHGDLNIMNIMTDNNLENISVIDPLESKWADKEYDLFQLRNIGGDSFHLYETYKKKFQVSEKCDMKCDFYALFNEVYCYITSGIKVDFILTPLVLRMKKDLKNI